MHFYFISDQLTRCLSGNDSSSEVNPQESPLKRPKLTENNILQEELMQPWAHDARSEMDFETEGKMTLNSFQIQRAYTGCSEIPRKDF